MSDSGWPHAAPDGVSPEPEPTGFVAEGSSFESDLADLAAKFSVHSGGSLPDDLSTELALEIVLNEIVEQACLATGATGAAVVLEREGEMVCRASSGPTAPELGARLDIGTGLSGECMRTGMSQRCDDAQNDPRADATASERLGLRSVLVLPLVGRHGVIGLFEIFSPRANAFGERDERTLEALAARVLKNLERAAEPVGSATHVLSIIDLIAEEPQFAAEPQLAAESLAEEPRFAPELLVEEPRFAPEPLVEEPHFAAESLAEEPYLAPEALVEEPHADPEAAMASEVEAPVERVNTEPRRRVDVLTWALSAAVLACTLLLALLIVQRFGLTRGIIGFHAAKQIPVVVAAPKDVPRVDVPKVSEPVAEVPAKPLPAPPSPSTASHTNAAAPPGSLLVFENGKEIFRMPPSQGQGEPPASAQETVERASSVAPEKVVDLSPAAAKESLIHRVEPDYPEPARDGQVQGAVLLDVRIGKDGTVQGLKTVSGEPLLAEAAMTAVRQWRFKPRSVNGEPVEMQTQVTLNFRLPN
jgi:TonB family protein